MKNVVLFVFLALAALVLLSQVPDTVSTAQAARPTPGPPPVVTPAPSPTPVSAR